MPKILSHVLLNILKTADAHNMDSLKQLNGLDPAAVDSEVVSRHVSTGLFAIGSVSKGFLLDTS